MLNVTAGEPNQFSMKPCRDDFITKRGELDVAGQPDTQFAPFEKPADQSTLKDIEITPHDKEQQSQQQKGAVSRTS